MEDMKFNAQQQYTYNRIRALQDELQNKINPTEFILNSDVASILSEIDELVCSCDHKFVNNMCIICGEMKKEE